jgi:hypothetical protein
VPRLNADKVGALLMMDMAHISGLVAAQEAAQVRPNASLCSAFFARLLLLAYRLLTCAAPNIHAAAL